MRNTNGSDDVSRRSALKGLSALGATLTIGTASGAASGSARSSGDGQISYDGLELPYPDVTVKRLHPSVRRVTNHPELLTLSEDAIERHFQQSDLEGRDYRGARKYVSKLRKAYPVERVEDGNEITLTLADGAKQNKKLTPNEAKKTDRQNAIGVFAGSGPDTVETQWDKNHHTEITDSLLEDSIGADYTIETHSDDPDEFGDVAKGEVDDISSQISMTSLAGKVTKYAVTEVLKVALDVYHSNWAQYYDPDATAVDFGPLGEAEFSNGLGRAPRTGDEFFTQAINESSRYDGEKKLGWSLHYLQDCAQPLHTGMGMEQAGLDVRGLTNGDIDFVTTPKKWLHYGFEHIVNNNWKSSDASFADDNLQNHMRGSSSPRIYSAAQAIRDMAGVSSQYSYNIYDTIYSNQSESEKYWNWDDSTKRTIYENLANCFSTLGYLGRGFAEEFERDF
ncbi:hypothetical protein [Halorussus sp. MSC15.2]|uniref:hypothetical protein n=1 Tax=Halorussus sp. MSC15.2 TaxID=2283638 RepID=UPI0013D0D781|nr:hypothetical protein [Halorussus sp. MSC15.2]NEU56187.1 hypothetical protein [Halorussus sp. MSC15.2]